MIDTARLILREWRDEDVAAHNLLANDAITSTTNAASYGVMERLGMTRLIDGDFNHPALAEGDRLRPHITYRIDRP